MMVLTEVGGHCRAVSWGTRTGVGVMCGRHALLQDDMGDVGGSGGVLGDLGS